MWEKLHFKQSSIVDEGMTMAVGVGEEKCRKDGSVIWEYFQESASPSCPVKVLWRLKEAYVQLFGVAEGFVFKAFNGRVVKGNLMANAPVYHGQIATHQYRYYMFFLLSLALARPVEEVSKEYGTKSQRIGAVTKAVNEPNWEDI